MRRIARDVGADQVVSGAHRARRPLRLDVKVVSADEAATRARSSSPPRAGRLLTRVNELATACSKSRAGRRPRGRSLSVRIDGVSEELALELPKRLRLQRGASYESSASREDLRTLREVPGIAAADVETERSEGRDRHLPPRAAEKLIQASPLEKPGERWPTWCAETGASRRTRSRRGWRRRPASRSTRRRSHRTCARSTARLLPQRPGC